MFKTVSEKSCCSNAQQFSAVASYSVNVILGVCEVYCGNTMTAFKQLYGKRVSKSMFAVVLTLTHIMQ